MPERVSDRSGFAFNRESAMRTGVIAVSIACLGLLFTPPRPADGGAGADAQEVQAVLRKAMDFLKAQQTPEGAFAPQLAGPGVTALVVAGLVKNGVSPKDATVARALAYLEKQVKPDGG